MAPYQINVESGPDWWLHRFPRRPHHRHHLHHHISRPGNGRRRWWQLRCVCEYGHASRRFNVIPASTTWATQSFTFVAEAETHTLTISQPGQSQRRLFRGPICHRRAPPDPWTPGDGIWTGGDGDWNTATNWQADTIGQGIDKSATFNGLTPVTATVDVNRPIGSLIFSGANHTLAAGTGSLTLDGDTLFTTPTVTVADGFTATIAAALNGSEGLLKTGTGTLVLSGTNSYSGTTEISQGTLKYQGGSFASETHTIASGAVLEFNVPTGTYNGGYHHLNGAGTLRKTGAGNRSGRQPSPPSALEPGALIDVQEGTLTGGSFGNESWAANFSDLNVAAGATFSTVEANVRLNKITGSGTLASGYPGAGYQNLTIGVNDGSSTFNGVIANAIRPRQSRQGRHRHHHPRRHQHLHRQHHHQ